MACSEKQLQANRLNAQKSTGPVTAEGKAVSRGNAVKHGFCASVVAVMGEQQAQLDAERDAWVAELAPQGHVARRLAEEAFAAYVRLGRCRRAETAATAERQIMACKNWILNSLAERRDAMVNLVNQPETSYRVLRTTPQGCDWMANVWGDLKGDLEVYRWNENGYQVILGLLGIEQLSEPSVLHEIQRVKVLIQDRFSLQRDNLPVDADEETLRSRYSEARTAELLWRRKSGEGARARLIGLFESHREECRKTEAEVQPEYDRRTLLARDQVLIDDSPEAARRQRYALDAERSLHRNIKAAVEAVALSRLAPDHPVDESRPEANAEAAPPDEQRARNEPNSERSIEATRHDPTTVIPADLSVSVDLSGVVAVPCHPNRC